MLAFLKTFYYTTGRYAFEEASSLSPPTAKDGANEPSMRHLEKDHDNQSNGKPWKLESTTTTTGLSTQGAVAEASRHLFTAVVLVLIVGLIFALCFLSMCARKESNGSRRGVLTGLREARSGKRSREKSVLPLFDAKEM